MKEHIEQTNQNLEKFEKIEKYSVKEYFKNLGLTNSDLKDKQIIDIGAGARLFAGFLVRNKISEKVYCIEPYPQKNEKEETETCDNLWDKRTKQILTKNSYQAFSENLPLKDNSFDLVIINASLPGIQQWLNKNFPAMKEAIKKSFNEYIRILKKGGEARLAPYLDDTFDDWYKPWQKAMNETLKELKKRNNLEIIFEPIKEDSSNQTNTFRRIIIKKN